MSKRHVSRLMPTTRSAAARSAAVPPPLLKLLQLPDDLSTYLCVEGARRALVDDLRAALRFRETCKTVRDRLAPVRAEAEARRLRLARLVFGGALPEEAEWLGEAGFVSEEEEGWRKEL